MPHRWSRRQVVQGAGAVGLGLLAGCGRWPGQAQPAKVPRVGFLYAADNTTSSGTVLAQALQEIGYIEGQNIAIETRIAEGNADLLMAYTADLVRLPVDIIVAVGGPATLTARHATATIPIVQAVGATDLVREGVVASLARPGGNVTGLTAIAPELSAKRLQLLQEAVPGLSRVAVLWNPAFPSAAQSFEEIQGAASLLGLQLHSLELRQGEHLESHFDATARERDDGLVVLTDAITVTQHESIAALALRHRLPAIFDRRDFAVAGGLMGYGPDFADMARRAAVFVDRILKGAKPADLPIERPQRFEFAINLRTAQALGLTIPHHVLLQATEVIR